MIPAWVVVLLILAMWVAGYLAGLSRNKKRGGWHEHSELMLKELQKHQGDSK